MLKPHDISNFNTLSRAFARGDSALVEVQRVDDGAIVAAICAVGQQGDLWIVTPFATMIEENPYELFHPPNPDGGFGQREEGT